MNYTEINGLSISAITLGTVQLGMDYGIGGITAKPSRERAFSILDGAVKNGVTVLDTANNYGDSENVIGQWLKASDSSKKPLIVTKIGPFDRETPEKMAADIIAQTEKCLSTLGIKQIDILMLHDFEDYKAAPEVVSRIFLRLKEEKVIRLTGISAYSEDDYRAIAASGFDTVQIPLNLFDWSQIENGGIKAMTDAGMTIFVRSVFLQGLVFFKADDLDPRMDFARKYIEKFASLCESFHLSPPELALSFALSVPGISSAVLGCQTAGQVEENCRLFDRARKLSDGEMSEIRAAFLNIDPRVTDPRRWYNKF